MKKLAIISLFVFLIQNFEIVSFSQSKESSLTPEQIVEKHIVAIGGREKLDVVKTRVAEGLIKTVTAGQTHFFLLCERPDKMTVLYRLRTYDWKITYAAENFYSSPILVLSNNVLLTGKSNNLENKFKEMYSSGLLFGDMSLYNILTSPNPKVVMKSGKTKKINDRMAYTIEFKQKNVDSIKAYFDVESFMLIRIDHGSVELPDTRIILDNSPNKGQTIDFYQEFSDFREVDGIKLPFKLKHVTIPPISQNQRAGLVDVEITGYKHNLKIDPKLFSYN